MEDLASAADRRQLGVKHCIGFGQSEGHCGQLIDHESRGLNPAGLWCVNCELNRREHIDRQMQKITKGFGA